MLSSLTTLRSLFSLPPHSSPAPFPYTPCSVRCSFHLFVLYYDTRLPDSKSIKSNQSIEWPVSNYRSICFPHSLARFCSLCSHIISPTLSWWGLFCFSLEDDIHPSEKDRYYPCHFQLKSQPLLNAHELCYLSIAPPHEHLFIALILAMKGIDR